MNGEKKDIKKYNLKKKKKSSWILANLSGWATQIYSVYWKTQAYNAAVKT